MTEERLIDCIVFGAIIMIIGLKITNVITIPWVWLLAPIWITAAIGIIVCIFITICYFIRDLKRRKRNERY